MKRRTVILMVLALAAVLVVSTTAAFAAPGGGNRPDKPTTTTPTTTTPTTTQPGLRLCETLGSGWTVGHYDEAQGKYVVGGLAGGFHACITLRPEHAGTRYWRVDWIGTVARPPGRGLDLVFESEVSDLDNAYLHERVYGTTGTAEFLVEAPGATPFIFVSVPHPSDKWSDTQITLTPLAPPPLP